MRGAFTALFLTLLATHSLAQEEPRVTTEFEKTETLVGQPLVLRIKVLVSTWMPQPPEFPTLEVPGLMVRLPERASSPISENIDGETWSGVQRAYRLYPLSPGTFTIPAQEIRLSVADPGKTDPILTSGKMPEIVFRAGLPEAAGNLDPPVIATGFTLEQNLEGPTDLAPGDAVTRTITATISGTTPVLIPSLTPQVETDSVRAYPSDPSVSETEDRGTLSGQRSEKTSYVAQSQGTVDLPEVAIDWFNIESGAVETATVPATTLTVSGVLPGTDDKAWLNPRWAVYVLVAILITVLFAKWAIPQIQQELKRRKLAWQNSEPFAFKQVKQAFHAQNLSEVYTSLARWETFFPWLDEADRADLEQAMAEIGRRQYGVADVNGRNSNSIWSQAEAAFVSLRDTAVQRETLAEKADTLPPLNAKPSRV